MSKDAPDNPGPPASGLSKETSGAMAAAIRLIFGFTLVSRVLGLGREVLTARVLGDTAVGSAFAAAFVVPNLFRRLFGEGALSAAFLPEYARLVKADPELSRRLASLILALLVLVSGSITLIAELGLLAVLRFAEPGESAALSIRLTMLMLPMMPMVCLTAILGGMLQAHGKFGPPAAAPVVLNVLMIAGCGVYFVSPKASGETVAYWVGSAAVLASVLQIVWSMAALRSLGDKARLTRDWRVARDSAMVVAARFGPVVVGLGALQLSTALDQLIAMWPIWVGPTMFGFPGPLDERSNSILAAASRFYQFPLGVFGLAVATAVFPLLSRAASDPREFAVTLRRGVRISLLVGLPAAVGLMLVADHLTHVMLAGGTQGGPGYRPDGVFRAAGVLTGFAPAVWAYSLNNVLTRAFYARGDTRTPMVVSLFSVGLNLALTLVLIWPLGEAGMAWAAAGSATFQFLLLHTLLRRRQGVVAFDDETARGCLGIAMCTAVMAGVLIAARFAMPTPLGWWGWAWQTGVLIVAGGGTFAVVALARRLPELRWLTQRGPTGGAGAYLSE